MKQISETPPIFSAIGIVIHGRGIGKFVGTPTANLQLDNVNALPQAGVYITKILLEGQTHYGVTHIGKRPTVDNDNDISIETHILNFNKDIYGWKRTMEIELYRKLRSPKKYNNLSMLLEQIRLDCSAVWEYFDIEPTPSRLCISIKKHQIKIDNTEIYLSTTEFDVLYILYSNPGVAFTKEQIYEAVWHEAANGHCHAVENTIFQIRKKIATYSKKLNFIKTIAGYGYKYNLQND